MNSSSQQIQAVQHMGQPASAADIIDRVLDKGLVINADIAISIAQIELLGIRIRAVLASLETAARYGLALPAGTNMDTNAWREALVVKESCPDCGKRSPTDELLAAGCPWCGWVSAKTRLLAEAK